MSILPPRDLCPRLDLMLANQPLSSAQAEAACRFALEHGFSSVMVPNSLAPLAQMILKRSGVKLIVTIDGPSGQSTQPTKVMATSQACTVDGVSGVGVVLNHTAMLDGRLGDLIGELRACRKVSVPSLGAMFEMSLLTDPSQRRELVGSMNLQVVEWLQPHIGLRRNGSISITTLEDVALLRELAPECKVRAYAGPLSEWTMATRLAEVANSVAIDWRPSFAA